MYLCVVSLPRRVVWSWFYLCIKCASMYCLWNQRGTERRGERQNARKMEDRAFLALWPSLAFVLTHESRLWSMVFFPCAASLKRGCSYWFWSIFSLCFICVPPAVHKKSVITFMLSTAIHMFLATYQLWRQVNKLRSAWDAQPLHKNQSHQLLVGHSLTLLVGLDVPLSKWLCKSVAIIWQSYCVDVSSQTQCHDELEKSFSSEIKYTVLYFELKLNLIHNRRIRQPSPIKSEPVPCAAPRIMWPGTDSSLLCSWFSAHKSIVQRLKPSLCCWPQDPV